MDSIFNLTNKNNYLRSSTQKRQYPHTWSPGWVRRRRGRPSGRRQWGEPGAEGRGSGAFEPAALCLVWVAAWDTAGCRSPGSPGLETTGQYSHDIITRYVSSVTLCWFILSTSAAPQSLFCLSLITNLNQGNHNLLKNIRANLSSFSYANDCRSRIKRLNPPTPNQDSD